MWSSLSLRRNNLSVPLGNSRGRIESNRNRRQPRLEALEDRQLLSGLTVSAGGSITTNAEAAATFNASVSGGKSPYTYSWNFGDGTSNSGNTASFVGTDPNTQGTWIGTYGSAGYDVIKDAASYPSYVTVTPSGQSSWTWASPTSNARGLQEPGTSSRIAACWYSSSSFEVTVDLTDGQIHPVSLYALDFDSTSRAEQIQVLNASNGAVLNTQTITSFHNGEYLTWNVSGDVEFKITCTGGVNAVLSGVFIGAPSTGGTSNVLIPTYTYANPGTYTATLTATDAGKNLGFATAVVTVNDVPPTVSESAPASGKVGVATSFSATATDVSPAVQATGFTYGWKFGDGTTATGASPSHTFTAAGTYTVTVTATDEYGKSGTASNKITISSLARLRR